MKKIEIFEDIIKIMNEDSSTCKDVKGADPKFYMNKIDETMRDEDFVYLLSSYLATFGLTGHLRFGKKGLGDVPFRVQRYQDELYILEVYSEDTPLHVGDKIVGVDGLSVKDFCEKNSEFFYNQPEERQSVHWRFVLRFAKELSCVDKNGNEYIYQVKCGDYKSKQEKYYYKKINDEVSLIYLADFQDESAIIEMYNKNKEKMDQSKYLIIDVRNNGGGTDSAFIPLIRYCLPEGVECRNVKLKGNKYSNCNQEINYSKRNCEIRKKSLLQCINDELPAETQAMVRQMLVDLDNNCGKGFVVTEEDDGSESIDLPYVGDTKVEKVFVITDGSCGSSGDNCVLILGAFPKVTVVGRPTMGIMDYSNVAMQYYDDFFLMYPTSRLTYIDDGIHMMEAGIDVEKYIPWTPEHLEKDIDVEYILENLI